MALRQRYQEPFTAKHGIKLGFMSFFVKASIEALRQFPVLNASVDGNDIVYHEFFDIGVAVSTERGLVVPVLRNAEAMGFGAIEHAIRDFGERARKGALQMDELHGRHVHDHERRHLRLDDVDADLESAAERHSRHAQDPGTADGRRRQDRGAADDVSWRSPTIIASSTAARPYNSSCT